MTGDKKENLTNSIEQSPSESNSFSASQ